MKNKKALLIIAAFSIWVMTGLSSCKKEILVPPASESSQQDTTGAIFHGWPAGVDSVK